MGYKKLEEFEPVVTIVKGDQVNCYQFRFKDTSWWANFYTDEVNGTLILNSDWGDYMHRWGRSGNSNYDTFDQFISNCNTGYIMDKFSYGRDDFREFKPEESAKELQKHIVEMRIREELTRSEARIYYNHIQYLAVSCTTDESFHTGLHQKIEYIEIDSHEDYKYEDVSELEDEGFSNHLGIEAHEWLVHGDTNRIKLVGGELIPVFLKWLKEHLK